MDERSFLDAVYGVLRMRHPHGMTLSLLGQTVRRSAFTNPPQWTSIPSVDTRFRLSGVSLFLKESPAEGASDSNGRQPTTREDAADSFYAFLQTLNIRSAVLPTIVQSHYETWRHINNLACGLSAMLLVLEKTERLRYVRGHTLLFGFCDGTRINLEEVQRNKGGIVISEITLPASVGVREEVFGTVRITNEGTQRRELESQQFLNYPQLFRCKLGSNVFINAGQTIECDVVFQSAQQGAFADTLLFKFNGFCIARVIKIATVRNPGLAELLKPAGPYVKPTRRALKRNGARTGGERPPSSSRKFDKFLPNYPIPEEDKYLNRTGEIDNVFGHYQSMISSAQSSEKHKVISFLALYNSMLYHEELAMNRDIQSFDMRDVVMRREGRYLVLQVPGLAEKRPSVLIGDEVIVNRAGDDEDEHSGFVWIVRQQEICIHFHDQLASRFVAGMKFDVRFTFRRTHLNMMHDAYAKMTVERSNDGEVDKLMNVILPADPHSLIPEAMPTELTACFNRQLNQQQKLAVSRIVERGTLPEAPECNQLPPFVIFGPPGTGKTSTMVESILQVKKRFPKRKLLVMAPSNAAADVLLTKLSAVLTRGEMLRLMSFQRNHSEVSATVLNYCIQDANNHFVFPAVSELTTYQVIVCTCAMASKLYYYGMPAGYFSYVFIDESGHCWEPEAITAFYTLLSKDSTTRLVLAGDPKQLGPIVRDPYAGKHGLQMSLLERYVTHLPAYAFHADGGHAQHNGYDPRYIVQLVHCYRCHPDIMHVPNELFYHNHLISSADPVMTQSMLQWPDLPNPRFPMLFHGCVGEHQRQLSSPSWFNITEAEIAVQYVQSILAHGRNCGIAQKDIGIISPYALQVKKIRQALEHVSLHNCTVGSCEQFQGQERRIIIISTVRSNVDFIKTDKEHDIGFLSNPKRFNVAITRAQALVIIIGNPEVLKVDPNWRCLLAFCVDNGGYTGVPFNQNDADTGADLTDLLRDVHLHDDDDDDDDDA